jgi:hypothetical protein
VWLKLFTALMLLVTVMLLVERPVLVGPLPPRGAKRLERLAYSEEALAYTGSLIVSITAAGIGSIVLVRRANAEYRRLSMENLEALIEGAIDDHKKGPDGIDEHTS